MYIKNVDGSNVRFPYGFMLSSKAIYDIGGVGGAIGNSY